MSTRELTYRLAMAYAAYTVMLARLGVKHRNVFVLKQGELP